MKTQYLLSLEMTRCLDRSNTWASMPATGVSRGRALGAGRGPHWATAAPFPDGSPHGSQVSFAFNTELEFMFFSQWGYIFLVSHLIKKERRKKTTIVVCFKKRNGKPCVL